MTGKSWWIRAASFTLIVVPLCASGFKQEKTQNSTQPTAANTSNTKDKTTAQSYIGNHSADPSQYVGTDTCKTCHEDIGKTYDRGPHWKTMLDKHHGVQ